MKVDVIVPAYNAERYLAQAIESVITQTYDDWRIIVIDDGSTDSTSEIAARYATRLGRKLCYVRQENKGLPAARNTAIRSGTAELLALLDADDVWLPHRLHESVKCFTGKPSVGLSYGRISRINSDGLVLDTPEIKLSSGHISRQIYTREVHLPCPTVTFRRECVEKVGGFDETLRATEDRDLWFRIANSYEVAVSHEVLANYRISGNQMSSDPDRMMTAQKLFVAKYYGYPQCGFGAKLVALSTMHRECAEAFRVRKKIGGAMMNALHALALNPFEIRNAKALLGACFTNREEA